MGASREIAEEWEGLCEYGEAIIGLQANGYGKDFLKSLRSRAVGNSPFQAVESRQTYPPNAQTRRILTAFFSFETRKHLQHSFGLPSLLRPVNLAPDCAVQAGQQSINLWRLAHVRSVQIQDE